LNLDAIIQNNPVCIGADPKLVTANEEPVVDILMFKALRKERRKEGNSDQITNVEEKVIRLNGIDFH
jgi:hypothetical protein